MRFTLISLLSFIAATASNAADNWPQFRGPTGDGISDAKKLPVKWTETENVRWKTPIHDKGWSSPVIWGDQIWMTTSYADYKDKNAKEVAMQKIPKPLFVDFFAVCVDRVSGKIVHDVKLYREENADYCHSYNSYATPTPVIEEGRLYCHFGSHGTVCLDTKTTKILWERRDIKCDHFRGPGSSPITDDKLLYLTFDGFDVQYMLALDKKTGENVWKQDRNIPYTNSNGDWKKAYSTPSIFTIDGKRQLVSPAAEATIAYEPESGKEIWRVNTGGMNEASKPVLAHGLIYLTNGNKKGMIAIKANSHGQIAKKDYAWETIKGVPTRPSVLVAGDYIYMVNDDGFGSCIDAKTGKQIWTERLCGTCSASPVLAENKLYFCDQDGITNVVEASPEFNSLAKNKLADGCMASPAISGDAIYLRTKTHLYCIGKK